MSGIQIVWFKRDLRVHDHLPLLEASRAGPVLPLYVVEPGVWRQDDVSGRHWDFLREGLTELRADFAARGRPLVVRHGGVTDVLSTLRETVGIAQLWSHQETGNGWTYARDREVAAWCRRHGVAWVQHRQNGVVRGLGSRDGWARGWDAFMRQPAAPAPERLIGVDGMAPGDIPTAAQIGLADDPCPGRQRGGRREAMALLSSFLDGRGARYHREMSSPLTAAQSCSRLSAHLAAGTVSMREVAQAAWRRQEEIRALPAAGRAGWGRALNAFVGRLHWHCHFMQKLEDAPRHETRNVHSGYDGLREGAFDTRRFKAWAEGQTGFPFVDACMRSLQATGWINFRMRAMLTAFASYHLWLHWRAPGLHLARLFTDYEPGIYWNQVQMQSGTTGINTVRVYNPVKQSHDHDPDGRFIREWVPEVRRVPDAHIHEPWRMSLVEQEEAGCVLGIDYSERIVDHMAAARVARDRIYAVRRGTDYRAEADAIQSRHGSRKRGLPRTGRRPRKAGRGRDEGAQPSLEL